MYSFNQGDLHICADVLQASLDRSALSAGASAGDKSVVAWEDLRYIFGEIMYGGHITDPWDRRTNNTYLQVLFTPHILEGGDLASYSTGIGGEGSTTSSASSPPGHGGDDGYDDEDKPAFALPSDIEGTSYDDFTAIINEKLPTEAPQMFGLHPNSEIGYLTAQAKDVFESVMLLEGAEPFQKEEASARAIADAKAEAEAKSSPSKGGRGRSGISSIPSSGAGSDSTGSSRGGRPGIISAGGAAGIDSESSSSDAAVRATLEGLLSKVPQSFPMLDL